MAVHNANLSGQDTVESYIREYPNQEQVRMMNKWLADHEPGTFSFTGLVDPTDDTVITPQATVDYGYCWFSLSEGPAMVRTPSYGRFFSVSLFDMRHNTPDVVVNPDRPILLIRPGQECPEGDFHVVELETDQGLVLTRMVVVENMEEVRQLSASVVMDGGDGDMHRDVQRFSPGVEAAAMEIMETVVHHLNPDNAFGRRSGEVGELHLAGGVFLGQLGTPSDTVRYGTILTDQHGAPFNGTDTYVLRVPAGIVHDNGYFSVTIYSAETKLLMANEAGVYDQTTYSAEQNDDGTYTITLSPDGSGKNGIPTGQSFYGILRAYMPIHGADMTVTVTNG
jgi:hypothetical protein